MIEVVHVADTHLGHSQYQLEERKQDFRDAFTQVIDYAVENDVNAVVHGGDLFHNSTVEPGPLNFVVEELLRLKKAGVPFLTIVGNHDGQSSGPEWMDILQNVGLVTRLGDEPTVVGDVAFYGIDHKTEGERKDLTYQFIKPDVPHTALVAHGLFTPVSGTFPNWDLTEVLTETNIDFDAVLLGDDHTPNTEVVKGAVATYPGSTERTAADQEEDRGFNLVTIGKNGVDVTRELLDTRPFVNITVDLEEGEGLAEIKRRIDAHDVTDACVRVKVFGDDGETFTAAAIEEYVLDKGALRCKSNDKRDTETELEDRDVNFANPTESFRDELRDMNLSDAALTITEKVRKSDRHPDSKIQQHTHDWITDQIEESPGDFVRPEPDDGDDDHQDSTTSARTVAADESTSNADSSRDDIDGEELNEEWDDHYDDVDESGDDTGDEVRTDGGESQSDSTVTPSDTSGQTGLSDW